MRAELMRELHQALHEVGCADSHISQILGWINDADEADLASHAEELSETRRTWMLRALGTGAIGVALGIAACAVGMSI